MHAARDRHFVLLQGPTNLLFAKLAGRLRARGHPVDRINACIGDQLFWRGPGALDFRGRAEEWPRFVADHFDRHGVTDLVLLGEKRDRHREAIAAAHARGIAVTVTDFGYLRPDWIVVERDGLNGDSHFPRDAASILASARGLPAIDRRILYPHRPVNQALWDMGFHLSSAFFPFTFPHFRRHTLNHPLPNYLATAWRLARSPLEERRARALATRLQAGAESYLFAMQMEDDYSLRGYSRYPDLDSAMDEAIRSFAVHAPAGSQLIFKSHPLDPGLKRWQARLSRMANAAGAGERIHFMDGGDLDAMIRASRGLVTVNSTAGLRALELGRPTIALGETIYRVPGLAFAGTLDDFWTGAPKPDVDLVDAALRLMAAMLHVRGSMYDPRGIEAAADGMAYRLHHGLVNAPLAQPLLGERLALDPQ
ncbi:MAG TPA: capsular biosynthesis protein [Usitatibacter sp.]|nr:capsular biosynthesis protein [Usitatibacter sp.]